MNRQPDDDIAAAIRAADDDAKPDATTRAADALIEADRLQQTYRGPGDRTLGDVADRMPPDVARRFLRLAAVARKARRPR